MGVYSIKQSPPVPNEESLISSKGAVINRYLDFWLLGGASIVLWLVMFIADHFRTQSWAINHHFENMSSLFASLSLLINYPHFMASYKLVYGRGFTFVKQNWTRLILVPVLLFFVMTTALLFYFNDSSWLFFIKPINQFFEAIGWETRLGFISEAGGELLNYLLLTMYFTVGWHYTKQIYGCMMVYASYDQYPLSLQQRKLLRWGLFGIWFLSFFRSQTGSGTNDYHNFEYYSLNLPAFFSKASWLYLIVSVILVFQSVFWANYRKQGRIPSLNFLTPYIAMHLWWIPTFYQAEYVMYAVPFFHCLQYLAFVDKIEIGTLSPSTSENRARHRILLGSSLVIVGFLTFELIPSHIDSAIESFDLYGFGYFFVCAGIFINIHHYFIDNVLWRMSSDTTVRKLLLNNTYS